MKITVVCDNEVGGVGLRDGNGFSAVTEDEAVAYGREIRDLFGDTTLECGVGSAIEL